MRSNANRAGVMMTRGRPKPAQTWLDLLHRADAAL
jgi:hypothetical protein